MMNMTHTTFDTPQPREVASGRFAEMAHSAPETRLAEAPVRPADAQEAIDKVTFGREHLERRLAVGGYDIADFRTHRSAVWGHAGGPAADVLKLERHLGGSRELTADRIEAALEATYHRARSGRYMVFPDGTLGVIAVDELDLRAADRQAETRTEHVEAMWSAGQDLAPGEGEISEQSARLFAEQTLQTLPETLDIAEFPRLAEFANEPYCEDGGASADKVDALHYELSRIRQAHSYLNPRIRLRLDMLSTFALHALPGQP